MKHCKKFSGPNFSLKWPPPYPPCSHRSLQQNSSPTLLLPSSPDRFEMGGKGDRGSWHYLPGVSCNTQGSFRFFFSVICDEIFSFYWLIVWLTKLQSYFPFPFHSGSDPGPFYHNSHIPTCVCFGDRLLNIDLALTFISCCMTPKQSDCFLC